MEQIFDNHYLTFDLSLEKSIFVYTWKSTSEKLKNDELLVEAQRILETALQHNIRSVIGVDTDFLFPLSPELQELLNKSVLSVLNHSSVKKLAHVQSPELITQLGVEQLFEENVDKTYEDRYFSNLEEALIWCNSL